MLVDERSFFNGASHLLLAPPVHNEFVCALVVARLVAAGRLAPRSHRVTPAGRFAFTAAMRVIDRVHRNAAIVRAPAEPAASACFAERNVFVIAVADYA